ncbi:MAG: carbonic anhydrase [Nitrospirales bacterium]|nr:MAG: carbonic anhydrase [Nitrospirales bacterium]
MTGITRKILKGAAVAAMGTLLSVAAFASGSGFGMNADEALQKLMKGNKQFIDQQQTEQTLCDLKTTRQSLAKSQKPYAVILSCSDSRVPPEIIFNKGLGEIFVIRVAGNIPDPIVLGSIEYAVEHIGSPLIMVLGHERCGAVTATVDAKGKPEGNIGAIIKTIAPAVQTARKEYTGKDKAQLIETAVDVNVRLVAANLTKQSSVIKHLVKEGKVKIVTAKYDLDDGTVTVFK